MSLSNNISTICRICTCNNVEGKSIYAFEIFSDKSLQVKEVIVACASVQIEKRDGLPEEICSKCLFYLHHAYTFKTLCENSDYKLRNQVGKIGIETNNIKQEDDFFSESEENSDFADVKEQPETIKSIYYFNVKEETEFNCEEAELPSETFLNTAEQSNCGDIKDESIELSEVKVEVRDLHINESTNSKSNLSKKDQCNICNKQVVALKQHMRIHTGERPFKCNICPQEFRSGSNLNSHKKLHIGEKPFKCNSCEMQFTENSKLNRHKKVHTGKKPFKCNICELQFSCTSKLKIHIRTHTGEKPFKCDSCDLKFNSSGSLIHHRKVHSGEKPYLCNLCGRQFPRSNTLNRHKMRHTRERPFECEICGRRFPFTTELKQHMRIHTGEKPFKCEICDHRFARSSDLSGHRRVHTGEKPFKCEICDRQFGKGSHLNSHRKVHTGEKPFKCEICNRQFSRAGNLKCHRKLHAEKSK